MPNTKSAAKHLKSSLKSRARNRRRKVTIKAVEKQFLACVEAKDLAGAKEALKTCFSTLDKAAKVGCIHPNKADRKKSRLASRVQTLAGAVPAVAPAEAPASAPAAAVAASP
jgi:small subunit ribosomal protein S20